MSHEDRKSKLEAVRARNPGKDVYLVASGGKEFFVSSPNSTAWHQFKDAVVDPKRKRAAFSNLCVSCAIEPGPVELAGLIEKKPALAETLCGALAKFAGLDDEAEIVGFDAG